MVGYYLLLRGWLHFGDSVSYIRGLSVVFGVAAIPAIFLLGRKMKSTSFGLISALLLSINAFQVRYAQEVRSYSLLVLLLIVSTYCLISALESGRRRDWNWYIAVSSLAIYAHFFAVLVVVAHWVAVRLMLRVPDTELPGGQAQAVSASCPANCALDSSDLDIHSHNRSRPDCVDSQTSPGRIGRAGDEAIRQCRDAAVASVLCLRHHRAYCWNYRGEAAEAG